MKWVFIILVLTGFNLGIWALIGFFRFLSDRSKAKFELNNELTAGETKPRSFQLSDLGLLAGISSIALIAWITIITFLNPNIQTANLFVSDANDKEFIANLAKERKYVNTGTGCLMVDSEATTDTDNRLAINKKVDKTFSDPKDQVEYQLTINNQDNLPKENVQVTVFTAPEILITNTTAQSCTWLLPDLQPGDSQSLTYSVAIKPGTGNGDFASRVLAVDSSGVLASDQWKTRVQGKLIISIIENGLNYLSELPTTGGNTAPDLDYLLPILRVGQLLIMP